jgi:hypothetical protein
MDSDLGCTTSRVCQSPFERVNQWGMHVTTPSFTPSSYIPLQVVTSTPICGIVRFLCALGVQLVDQPCTTFSFAIGFKIHRQRPQPASFSHIV